MSESVSIYEQMMRTWSRRVCHMIGEIDKKLLVVHKHLADLDKRLTALEKYQAPKKSPTIKPL